MNQQKFVYLVLWITFLSVLLIFAAVLTLSLPDINGFDMTLQTPKLLKVLLPIIALYIGPITIYVISKKNVLRLGTRMVNMTYIFFSMSIALVHLAFIILMLFLAAFNQISFDNMLVILGLIEVAFGTYVNLLINDMFKVKKKKN